MEGTGARVSGMPDVAGAGALLGILPVNGGSSHLAIVGYLLPVPATRLAALPAVARPNEDGAHADGNATHARGNTANGHGNTASGHGNGSTALARANLAWAHANAGREEGDELVVDAAARQVLVGGRDAGLVFQEFNLLAHLTANPGQVLTREHLLARVWGDAYHGSCRTVDVHIHRLRRKLGPEHGQRLITVRRVGYLYRPGT